MKKNKIVSNPRIKLLMVDDEEGFVNIMAKRLGKRGVDVVKSFSGIDGIQILRRQDFDVALVDLKLEDMDGIEILTIFKKMVPDMPVIMLTGHGSEEAAKEGIKCGAFDYLTKPCDLEELVRKVSAAAGQGR